MYEENRKFSWTNLFIKAIIVLIFILFTVWLLSLSNKGLSNSLNVLTDDIFAQNIERMKEVGKDYFTTERLPQKVGEVETLTLGKMYDEHLILELKDKYGNTCSAKNSYVSVEKMENEYQMKVYLECGEEEDYIIVIMGCYDYCDTDICERKEETDVSKDIEYEYSKTTGGKWTDYGKWSEWSKVSVTNTSYRQVETKVVKEDYSYDKVITETVYKGEATCPNIGDGFTLASQNGNTCNYVKNVTNTLDPVCPEKDGYTVTRNGLTCTYTSKTPSYSEPYCSEKDGATVTRNGFTCTYKTTSTVTEDAICPSGSNGYTYSYRSGATCYYKKTSTVTSSSYTLSYYSSGAGYSFPSDTYYYHYVKTSTTAKYVCDGSCSIRTYYTYDIYRKNYGTTTKTYTDTKSVTCPTGYDYSSSLGKCVDYVTNESTSDAKCKVGTWNGSSCLSYNIENGNAKCNTGTLSNNMCLFTTTQKQTKTATCSTGQNLKDGKCYEDVTSTVTVSGTKDVTYYRYRVREYIGGTTDYKWSKSKNDQDLINAGYKLTGRTR